MTIKKVLLTPSRTRPCFRNLSDSASSMFFCVYFFLLLCLSYWCSCSLLESAWKLMSMMQRLVKFCVFSSFSFHRHIRKLYRKLGVGGEGRLERGGGMKK